MLALENRIEFFHSLGGRIADHGLNQLYGVDFKDEEVNRILKKRLAGQTIFAGEAILFQSCVLYHLAKMYHAKKWVMQFHLGAQRNNNEIFATMVGNYNDGKIVGKMQWGSGWWFLDQKDGMEAQMNVLSNMGLLSRFVGMLTDSRSFLSFPRHEYFRRILCNLIGKDIEKGQLPNDIDWLGKMVQDICYNNAKEYFDF